MKVGEYVAVIAGAAAIGFAIGSILPTSSAWPGEYLFPPSPFQPGSIIDVVQWCDRPEDMQSVIDTHATAGRDAASTLYDKLVESELCHLLPGTMPTQGALLEQTGFAYVFEDVPMMEEKARFVVEAWAAVIEGIEGRPVFVTLAYWSPEFSPEEEGL